jgi:hypothetical protein
MINDKELVWLKRALEALESGDCTTMAKHKLLRTISQITGRAADKIEIDFNSQMDSKLKDFGNEDHRNSDLVFGNNKHFGNNDN